MFSLDCHLFSVYRKHDFLVSHLAICSLFLSYLFFSPTCIRILRIIFCLF